MRGWAGFERRWLMALLAAVAPEGALPGVASVDGRAVFTAMGAHAPPLLPWGLRAAAWALTFLGPLVWLGRPRTFGALAPDDRDRMIRRAGASRVYLLRQLVLVLKLVASFILLCDPDLRRRLDPALADGHPGGAP